MYRQNSTPTERRESGREWARPTLLPGYMDQSSERCDAHSAPNRNPGARPFGASSNEGCGGQ